MPASMISAPTGGRPKVIGSSIATVAMVPMPGNTPTSVPTSAPIRHSPKLIGENATPKPRLRLLIRSTITPSLDQETREELERQPERVWEQQAAAQRQHRADDGGFDPFRLGRTERGDHETGEGREHETQRTDRDGKGEDRKRDEQRPAPVISGDMRPFEEDTHEHHAKAEREQQPGEHARRGAGTEGKSVHAL